LNLTWETLEGAVKHNGPLLKGGRTLEQLPAAIVEYCQDHDLELDGHAGPEAQVAALSDDIAYNNHDIDDGLRAGLFEIADLMDLPLVGEMFGLVTRKYPGIGHARLIHEAVRRVINAMVEDVLGETGRRLAEAAPKSVADIRALGRPVAAFSERMAATDRTIKAFLYRRMYEHWKLNRSHSKARRVVADLFGLLFAEPNCLPSPSRERAEQAERPARARLVADYIAGMTDRYAILEHGRLFDPSERT
jgi:dGTPase